jgi:hypothetical protein
MKIILIFYLKGNIDQCDFIVNLILRAKSAPLVIIKNKHYKEENDQVYLGVLIAIVYIPSKEM